MKCFIIMPFAAEFDSVFEAVRQVATTALPDASLDCFWLKDVHAAGRITDDIIAGLTEATFCIADVSGNNANVMWETGYAMALGKPTILIGQGIASLPFDLRSHRVLEYAPERVSELRPKLANAITETLARYQLPTETGVRSAPPTQRTIAVTGTTNAHEAAAARRVEDLLSPYLSEETRRLVGSIGTVDLIAVRFLLRHAEMVSVVGYDRYDCAHELRQPIEQGRLRFIDASVQAIPGAMRGPSQRDALFCMRSDLVIILWDGESRGTERMVRYFKEQGVSLLLGFI